MSPAPLHSVSVAAAVIDDHGRALAIRRRDNGHWEPPGGVLELARASTTGYGARSRKKPGSWSNPTD